MYFYEDFSANILLDDQESNILLYHAFFGVFLFSGFDSLTMSVSAVDGVNKFPRMVDCMVIISIRISANHGKNAMHPIYIQSSPPRHIKAA